MDTNIKSDMNYMHLVLTARVDFEFSNIVDNNAYLPLLYDNIFHIHLHKTVIDITKELK